MQSMFMMIGEEGKCTLRSALYDLSMCVYKVHVMPYFAFLISWNIYIYTHISETDYLLHIAIVDLSTHILGCQHFSLLKMVLRREVLELHPQLLI